MRISDWSSDVCSSDLARLTSLLVSRSGVGSLHRRCPPPTPPASGREELCSLPAATRRSPSIGVAQFTFQQLADRAARQFDDDADRAQSLGFADLGVAIGTHRLSLGLVL